MPGERFHVRMVPEEGGPADRVVVEVGLEGFNILSSDGSRTLRKYPLHLISRWSMRGSSLILFTKSAADVEDRTVTLQGDEHTIRSVLDTLTSSCMQMAELLQSGATEDKAAANSLAALLRKSKRPAAALPTADQVEFWKAPEKAGWLYSQGEHIKTWRKRWFVLKQGFLFRFATAEVAPATKPRGVVDLSSVTDVADGNAATGRPNSVRLSTATGSKCYLAESETAQVEWISALEGAVARLMKVIAGVEDEAAAAEAEPGPSRSLAEQLQRRYTAVTGAAEGPSTGGGRAGGANGDSMLHVVNYDLGPSAPPAASAGPGASGAGYARHTDYGGYINVEYGSIAGAQMAPPEPAPAPGRGTYSSTYAQPAPGSGAGGYGGEYFQPAPAAAPPPPQYQPQGQQYQPQGAAQYPPSQQYEGYRGGGHEVPEPQYQQHGPQYTRHAPPSSYGQVQDPAPDGGVTLFDAATAPQAPPPAPSTPWQVHYTADGRPYYYNTSSGITTWEQPAA